MLNWKGKNVLVTGGNGFLGSWLVNDLVKRGAKVTCIIRDAVANSSLQLLGLTDKINAVAGTIEDYRTVERAMNEFEAEVVFHLAAQAIVGLANKSPMPTFEANIKGTWNVLEACRQLSVARTIVASSDKAYGEHRELPYKEDFALNGLTPYEASKSCTDLLARTYARTYGLKIAVTRCGNIYGGGDLNFSRIIPGTIKSVLNDERPVIRSDGTPVRDYIYVLDAVAAYITLAEQLDRKEVAGEAFNFGTEQPISVLELTKKIIIATGKKLEPNILGQAKNELQAQYLDWSKAKRILEWKPKYGLDDGLKETIDWYRKYRMKPIVSS
ncbi:TPA: NAD-dependent epimerase/dehydratase family protein [Candidatus Woesearchaeota archaeon]|nr:NAD-dependent epimerase/dehydratase family protein [Candidatus Woesearchaeota archaeon]